MTDYGVPCPVHPDNLLDAFKFHLGIYRGKDKFFLCKQIKRGVILDRRIKCLGFGVYVVSQEGMSRYFCIDLDAGQHHKLQVVHLRRLISEINVNATSLGLKLYLEKSKSGKGWHLWCFFETLTPAENLRYLAKKLLPKEVEVLNTESGYIKRVSSHQVIEVFPKQTQISENGVGSQVWLPFWSKCKEGSKFFNLVAFLESGKEEHINLEEIRLHDILFKTPNNFKSSPLVSKSKQYSNSSRGLFKNVISRCNAIKRMWEKDDVSHMERVALLAFALNTKTGLNDLVHRWNSDKTNDYISYARERHERPWSCKTMQEYGFCDPKKDALFEGHCMDVRINNEGVAVDPSPIRFASTKKRGRNQNDEI